MRFALILLLIVFISGSAGTSEPWFEIRTALMLLGYLFGWARLTGGRLTGGRRG